jgi:hypothetical protein
MSRDRIYQPTTQTVNDLAIGVMKISTGTATDTNAAASVTGGVSTLGSLKSSTLSMKPTFKEHKTAYPQILDFKIAELLAANYKAEVEEIGAAKTLALIDQAIDTLETGTPHYMAVEAVSEFANGGTLALFSPYAQLKPTLNMNFGDDFSSIPFEFEALTNPNYTNKELVYRARTAAASRSLSNQAVTQDTDNLGIGMFQVRIGKPSRRAAGVAYLYPKAGLRKQTTPLVASEGAITGAYTGLIDGAFVLTCTDSTAGALAFSVVLPDGTAGAPIAVVDSTPVVVGMGASIAFPALHVAGGPTYFTVGDVYVSGALTGSAIASNVTGVLSQYSFLTSDDNVGAIKSADFTTNPTFKEHFSGFPKVKDLIMLESSTVTVSTALEEISANTGALIKDFAVTPWDMLFDASVNGSLYYVPCEIVMNLATGGVLSFWFPNCQIAPEADYAPGNDWASMPFKLEAQIQGALSSMKRVYRQTVVPNI